MPYFGPLLKIVIKRCCCCCKRKGYKANTHLNPYFPFERRYASMLATVYIVCTYGISMPALFIVGCVIMTIQTVLDRLLIVYFFKPKVEHNDILNRMTLDIMKYALFTMCFIGALAIASNHNTITETHRPLWYLNEFFLDFLIWNTPQLLIYIGMMILAFFIVMDIVVRDSERHGKFLYSITKTQSVYLQRISNLDRKLWICMEHYRRNELGIRMTSDETLELLKSTPGKPFKASNDPISYDILADPTQRAELRYIPYVFCKPDETEQSKQISLTVHSSYTTTMMEDFCIDEAANMSVVDIKTTI